MGQHAGYCLGGDISEVERNPDREGAPVVDLAMLVSVVIVVHATASARKSSAVARLPPGHGFNPTTM